MAQIEISMRANRPWMDEVERCFIGVRNGHLLYEVIDSSKSPGPPAGKWSDPVLRYEY